MPLFKGTPPRRAWLVGHRGAAGRAPENTMASFRKALEMGADFVECDVHLSKDGRCVVMHDEAVERTTDGEGLIRDRTVRELKGLDAGSWFSRKSRGEKVPTLDELLSWARGRKTRSGRPLGVFVEVKNEPVRYRGIERRVLRAVDRSRMADRVVLISFDHGVVKRLKRLRPRILTGMLYSRPIEDPVERALQLKADAIMPRRNLVSRALVESAKARGLLVSTWTADGAAEMRKLLACGVDSVTTNFPDRLNRLLGG